MKKILSIVALISAMSVLFFSCKLEDNSVTQLNRNGMMLTSYWQTATERVLMVTPNTVFHFNAWLSAPAEERPAIEDKYFTYSKIRQLSDNEWSIIQNGKTLCRINTDGKLLSEPGAEWAVVDYNQSEMAINLMPFGKDSVNMVVSHNENRWCVMTQGGQEGTTSSPEYNPFFGFNITPESGIVPADLYECRCMVEGSGRYAVRTYQYAGSSSNPTEIHDYIQFTLLGGTTSDCFYWESGHLTMQIYADMNAHEVGATSHEQYDEVLIQDVFSVRGGNQYAEITMHDVTETWQVGRLSEYDVVECGNLFLALFQIF